MRLYTGWSNKTDTQFYFCDDFGNCKQKFMARKHEVLPPTTPLLCDHIT